MTNHRTIQPHARKVIVGVDTHKHVHVAVAIDTWGIRLGDRSCAADSDGYQQLITWAERHGRVAAFGIEGTGSYGAGLARAVRRAGHQVLEVNRGDRRTRRIAGKRHRGCAVGPGWPIDRYPEDRGRGGRDDAPPQGRAPDGGQSPHLGDDHGSRSSSPRRPSCERPSTRSPTRRSSNAAAVGAAARSIRRPPRRNIPSGRSPVAGSLSPSRSWTTTVTWATHHPDLADAA